eukprot:4281545-Pyramimonas_sp.AAC.1
MKEEEEEGGGRARRMEPNWARILGSGRSPGVLRAGEEPRGQAQPQRDKDKEASSIRRAPERAKD